MSIGAVTGREYKKTRVRGFAPWNPKPKTMEIVDRVKEIIAEYDIALTIRQVFYRLVGKYQYKKTEQSYDRLGEYLNRARRAGIIGFDSIRDDGDVVPPIPGWTGPEQFWLTVKAWAEDYFVTPQGDTYVEIWVEAAGMRPQIEVIADPFGVRVIPGGGFSSLTARRNAAMRLQAIAKKGKRVVVLLIGDFDPSGGSIMDVLAEEVIAFGATSVEFVRLAVTEQQARRYNLLSAPQKATDKRGEHMDETWQAEALDPPVLAEIVRTALTELIGTDAVEFAKERSENERPKILADAQRLGRKKY
jgi:hypothetical protein